MTGAVAGEGARWSELSAAQPHCLSSSWRKLPWTGVRMSLQHVCCGKELLVSCRVWLGGEVRVQGWRKLRRCLWSPLCCWSPAAQDRARSLHLQLMAFMLPKQKAAVNCPSLGRNLHFKKRQKNLSHQLSFFLKNLPSMDFSHKC